MITIGFTLHWSGRYLAIGMDFVSIPAVLHTWAKILAGLVPGK